MERSYNGYGELEEETCSIASQPVAGWHAVRDSNGRIIEKTETIGGETNSYDYGYDCAGRLCTVHENGNLVEEYQYDLSGVRVYEMNSLRGIAGRSYAYSDEDHLLTVGDTSYQYSVDGFLTTRTDGSGNTTTYDYSSRGELMGVTLPDGTAIDYVHDPLGRRIAKAVNGVIIEKYLWLGLTRLLAVYDGSDALLMRFEYADGRMPYAMTTSGGSYYLAYDQVGSLKTVADESGNIVKETIYDSFGTIITDSNPTLAIPFGFAGGLHDRDTSLIRFGHRDYDPDTGRWTAKDPIFFAGGDTDLYEYCMNDPLNGVDPEGRWMFSYNAGVHAPTGPWPVAVGGTVGSQLTSLDASGHLVATDPKPEAVAGVWADIGVSAGVSDLSGTGNQAGSTIAIGSGRYGGAQITLRNEFDPNKAWYDPLKYIDGVSVGLGLGLGLPVNFTTPIRTSSSPCGK